LSLFLEDKIEALSGQVIYQILLDLQMAKRHEKRSPTSLIVGKMQVKTTVRHHHAPIRIATIKKKPQKTGSFGEDVETLNPCIPREHTMEQLLWRQHGSPSISQK
jgi:hypothetical protein